jgi:hypothetical protein
MHVSRSGAGPNMPSLRGMRQGGRYSQGPLGVLGATGGGWMGTLKRARGRGALASSTSFCRIRGWCYQQAMVTV